MKNLFSIALVFLASIVALGQDFKPVTGEYLQRQQRGSRVDLIKTYSLMEFKSEYYKTHESMLRYEDYVIFAIDRAYESTDSHYDFKFKPQSDYILFKNLETEQIDRVIDLNEVFKDAKIKQIWHDKGSESIAISNDGRYLFIGTATNTYKFDLIFNTWEEIKINQKNISLSPANQVLNDKKLVFMLMKTYNGWDWFPSKMEFLEYEYDTKKFKIKS